MRPAPICAIIDGIHGAPPGYGAAATVERNLPVIRPQMRAWLLPTLVLSGLLMLSACGYSRSAVTWNGRTIEAYSSGSVSTTTGNDFVNMVLGDHTIEIHATQITVDGVSKDIPAFINMRIDVKQDGLTIQADGAPVWP